MNQSQALESMLKEYLDSKLVNGDIGMVNPNWLTQTRELSHLVGNSMLSIYHNLPSKIQNSFTLLCGAIQQTKRLYHKWREKNPIKHNNKSKGLQRLVVNNKSGGKEDKVKESELEEVQGGNEAAKIQGEFVRLLKSNNVRSLIGDPSL